VLGHFHGDAVFGAGQAGETLLHSAGGVDNEVYLARYTLDGRLDWVRRFGGSGDDFGAGLTALADGSLLVAGAFFGEASLADDPHAVVTGPPGEYCTFVARLDDHGLLGPPADEKCVE
jgi:hypothetical protein